ncbi:MAG: acyltransferase [Vicinamibacterales bacterium]
MAETSGSLKPPGTPARARYDGLDVFRAISIYGVVVIHFSQVLGLPSTPGLELVIRLRDCSFPIIVLTSFFVMTRSIMAKPDRSFGPLAAGRFMRLAVPCLIWTALYWVMWEVAGPLGRGGTPSWPPLTLWLTGFVHLWFLQFLFLGTVAAYPFIRFIVRRPRLNWVFAAGFAAATAAYGLWGREYLTEHALSVWMNQADDSLRIAATKAVAWGKYIPVGIAMAFLADTIDALYRRPAFRAATLAAAAAALLLHVGSAAPEVSRSLYSLAVFVVLLRPWPPGSLDWLRPAARYSYPIYIVHPAVAQVVVGALALGHVPASLPLLLPGSVAVFALSGVAAAMLRRVVPADWFLPLVPVGEARSRDRMR